MTKAEGAADVAVIALRRATHEQHQALENKLDLMSDAITLTRYVAVLRAFLPIYEALEPSIDEVLASSPVGAELDWPSRRKVGLIRSDLDSLGGVDTTRAEFSIKIPPVTTEAQALGALYVIEGATLGGQYIAPHISKSLGISATRFFSSYGDERALRWQQYRRTLRSFLAAQPDHQSAVETTAALTFDAFLSEAPQ